MRSLIVAAVVVAGCSNPPPECAPRGEAYEVCSDENVWMCPEGPADVVAFNLGVDEACNQEDDPVQCILDAEYQFIPMTLAEDCVAADMICVEEISAQVSTATCETE